MAEEEEQLGRPIIWRPATEAAPADTEEEEERCLQPPFAVIASSHTDLAVGRLASAHLVGTHAWPLCDTCNWAGKSIPNPSFACAVTC